MAITTAERSDILELIVLMFDAAPGATYLSAAVSAYEGAGRNMSNFVEILAGTSIYTSLHPNFQTAEEFAADLLETVGLTGDAFATSWVVTKFNAGVSKAQITLQAWEALSNLPAGTAQVYVDAADTLFNKTEVSLYYSVTVQASSTDVAVLQEVVDDVTEVDATVTTAKAEIDAQTAPPDVGKSFSLTTSVDTFTGTSLNDTFVANPGTGNANTFTSLDNLDGGGGIDVLNVTEVGTAGADAYALNTSATVKAIEYATYTVATDAADTVAADVSTWSGLSNLTVVVAGVNVATTVTTKANVNNVTVNGSGGASTITDSNATAGADVLASVTLVDTTGTVGVASDALTSLSLSGTASDVTVTAAAGTRALGLTLNNVDAGAIKDDEATSLTITTTGSASSSAASVEASKATTVSIVADETLTLAALTAEAATKITVTGDSKVTLTAATLTALTSIDSTGQTAGGMDVDAFTLGTGVAFAGGAGADAVGLGATTKAITTGAGNDRVLLAAGTTALGTGGSVDAGDGTADTLAFADADDAGTVSATATFEAAVSGFEMVELAGAAGAAVTVNLANLDDATMVKLSIDIGVFGVTISNMASGGTLSVTASQSLGATTTVGITSAATGTADVLNVSLASAGAGVVAGFVSAADVETVNIATDDTATTPTGIAHGISLTASAVKTITVAGDAGLAISNTATTLTTFDASGVTKGSVSWSAGALAAAATISGGAGADTISASAATKAVTLNGNAGNDSLTGSSTAANTIDGGAGNDTLTGGSAADTLTGGAGDDMLMGAAGQDMLTGGDGTDTFDFTVKATSGNAYGTVVDYNTGDIVMSTTSNVAVVSETFTTTKLSLADTAVFQDYLDAAAAGAVTTESAIKWFQFSGNTYLVEDNSAATTFQNGSDTVIKLTGVIDLSNDTFVGGIGAGWSLTAVA
jgi:S-layer protein